MSSTGADLVVVDSIQAVSLPDVAGPPGSLAQVRACSELLVGLAQAHRAAVVLVGHVTKQGTLAGPRSLEHLVDTVLTVEGDRHHALRMVRAAKHRFGPTGELGLFEMGEGGLAEVSDPYRMLLGDRHPDATGSAVLPDGRRRTGDRGGAPGARVASTAGSPRRTVRGLEPGRIGLLLAVLEQRCGIGLARADVYCSVAGGMRVDEPAADLPMAMAIVVCRNRSSRCRRTSSLSARSDSPARCARCLTHCAGSQRHTDLGSVTPWCPSSTPACPGGPELMRVESVAAAVKLVARGPAGGHHLRAAGS